ncbi:MAG: hypothetical protein J0H18_03955 [Rhizobiales bacterium]|nr:hypothetical protein [Hyphomicrobiales bacterium]OJY06109.1 MAG: hypothetical protein BGP07_00410 [Rhizobiales bacterium 63-22]
MLTPDEIQRRIEKCLADARFSQTELLMRRALHRLHETENGSQSQAEALMRQAGSELHARELDVTIARKPWLFEDFIADADSKTHAVRH